MSWNYRVVCQGSGDETTYAIHEVYYTEDGKPWTMTVNPTDLAGDSVGDLEWLLEQMMKALQKPWLSADDFTVQSPADSPDYRPEVGC